MRQIRHGNARTRNARTFPEQDRLGARLPPKVCIFDLCTASDLQQVFSPGEIQRRVLSHEPVFETATTANGPAVVEVYTLAAGRRPDANAPIQPRPAFFIFAEVAEPLVRSPPAGLWPVRRDLLVQLTTALALLLTVGLAGWGFRSYVRGRRLEQQVEIAREVQANLLPRQLRPAGGLEVAVEYQPADDVAGDLYDAFETEHGFALVIGDVSGKGVPAALLMGVIHGAVRASEWTASAAAHERETAALNRLLCEQAAQAHFASMFWAYLVRATSTLHYVNAGHLPSLLVRAENGAVEELQSDGPVLGLLPEAAFPQGEVEIRPEDVLALYSDGLVEATDPQGQEFGRDRLRDLLGKWKASDAERIRAEVVAAVRAFTRGAPLADDLTCVVVKFCPRKDAPPGQENTAAEAAVLEGGNAAG